MLAVWRQPRRLANLLPIRLPSARHSVGPGGPSPPRDHGASHPNLSSSKNTSTYKTKPGSIAVSSAGGQPVPPRLWTENAFFLGGRSLAVLQKMFRNGQNCDPVFSPDLDRPIEGTYSSGVPGAEWSRRGCGTLDDSQAHSVPLGMVHKVDFFSGLQQTANCQREFCFRAIGLCLPLFSTG